MSGLFQRRIPRDEFLDPHGVEPDGDPCVITLFLDADDVTNSELFVTYAQADLVWRNAADGRVIVWTMSGINAAGTTPLWQ